MTDCLKTTTAANYDFTPPPPELIEDWIAMTKPPWRHVDAGALSKLAAEWGYQQCFIQYELAAMDLWTVVEDDNE